jgi:hypothetical protein
MSKWRKADNAKTQSFALLLLSSSLRKGETTYQQCQVTGIRTAAAAAVIPLYAQFLICKNKVYREISSRSRSTKKDHDLLE